jgi:DHA1 family bicyclomycin/chloramphenicol resistance-like MFS transporter
MIEAGSTTAVLRTAAIQPAITRPPVVLMAVLSGLMALGSLSTDMYLPALPTIGQSLDVSVSVVQLTLTTFLVGFCGGQLIWGPIGDRYGRRFPAALGLFIFAVGSVGCALSTDIAQMIFWRAFQAFGAAAGPVLGRAMVRDLYGRQQAARVLSMLILVMGVAPLLGPLLGGFVLVRWTWEGIFWVQAALGIGGIVGMAMIRETLALSQRTRLGLTEMLVSYIELGAQPRLLGYALTSGAFYGATYAYLAASPFVYITLHHVPPQLYGWLFGLNICGMMLMNAANSRLVGTVGSDRMLRYGIAGIAVAGVILAFNAATGFGGLWGLVAPIFVVVSMNGAVVANAVAGALSAYPRKAGAASAVLGAIQFGMGIMTTAMTGWFANGTAFPFAAIMAVTGVGGLLANIFLVGKPPQDEKAALPG